MQDFIHKEQSSGILLLIMTVIAMIIANSPLGPGYEQFLNTKVGFVGVDFELKKTVLHWINDGLMVIFFFVVGLEIKREFLVGELANRRAATLPILAAAGGAIVPAVIYASFNAGLESLRGWGVPMATDIAFALGVLALLGSRVPFALKVFLTALAIVDDMLAVLVIALFYSSDLNFVMLGIGIALLAVLFGANMSGVRSPLVYGLIGVIIWYCFVQSGVHATIAGVLIAMTVPARFRIDAPTYRVQAYDLLHQFDTAAEGRSRMLTNAHQLEIVHEIEKLSENVQAPLQRMEHSLHTMVSFVIMPIFALANAGVRLSFESLPAEAPQIMLGIALGLLIGKPIGLVGTCWIAIKLKLADLPPGATWRHMAGIGVLAGIGFTMSLFIASLGFEPQSASLDAAKLAVLAASTVAGLLGYFMLSTTPAKADEPSEQALGEQSSGSAVSS
jgi:NhaA family Na+:H+ antiporter